MAFLKVDLAFFADDYMATLELSSIKAGYYNIGEVFLKHLLMFTDDLYVFCPSVCGLQGIPDVCQAYYGESHG